MPLPTNKIKQVKLPNNTTYDIVPEMLQKNGHSAELPTLSADTTIVTTGDLGSQIIELEDNGSTTAGTWLAKTEKISALAAGQVFLYKIVVAGASTTKLNINGLGAKTIYRYGTTKLSTQYPIDSYILIYYNGTYFYVFNDYDANSYAYVRQYQFGENEAGTETNYPILARYNLTNKHGSYDTAYTRFYTETYIDTSNGYLYAPKLFSNGNEVLTGITSSMVTTALGYTPYDSTNPNGYTSNEGTVTSVSAGTGLSISGTSTINPTVNVASGYKLPTTTEWANKLDAYTIGLSTGGSGVRHAKFMTIDYTDTTSEYSTLLKVSMVSAHGNATSYRFLQDVIISVSNTGSVSVVVYKQFGASAGTIDSVARQYGDIYYVIDTTNKIVDFYVLVGQYSQVNSTPYMRLGKALGGEITQYSGSATYYSSGDRTWGTGGDYVLKGDLANYQTKVSALGSTTKPVYISASGTFSESDTYAGGTKITLNGTAKGGTNATIYAPTSAITTSTAKQYLVGSTSSTSVAEEHTNTSCYMSNGELYSNGYVVALAKDVPTLDSHISTSDIIALFND